MVFLQFGNKLKGVIWPQNDRIRHRTGNTLSIKVTPYIYTNFLFWKATTLMRFYDLLEHYGDSR